MPTIFFDFDSTVVTKESLDEVIALALKNHPQKEKLTAQVEAITNQGINGELDFKQSVEARLAVCELNRCQFEAVGKKLKSCLTPGMADLFAWLKTQSWEVYIVSGGMWPSVWPVAESLGLKRTNVFANGLRWDEHDQVTGPDPSNLLHTNYGKTPVIEWLSDTRNLPRPLVLVGDGSNDLAAFKAGAVEHFIGFGANQVRTKVQQEALVFVNSVADLKTELKKIA